MFCSGIVHHLSSPKACAQTQTSAYQLVSCWCRHPSCYFHCAKKLSTHKLAHMLDSLVRVSRRVKQNPFASKLHAALQCSKTLQALAPDKKSHQVHPKIVNQCTRTHCDAPKHLASYELVVMIYKSKAGSHSWNHCTFKPWQTRFKVLQSSHAPSILFASCLATASSFNSLFKVLFMIPSGYLFAISLNKILICTWNSPPTLHPNAKECDS